MNRCNIVIRLWYVEYYKFRTLILALGDPFSVSGFLYMGFCLFKPPKAANSTLIIPINLCLSEFRGFRHRSCVNRGRLDCDLRCSGVVVGLFLRFFATALSMVEHSPLFERLGARGLCCSARG